MNSGMSELRPRPLLVLLIPPNQPLGRAALRKLQLHAGDQYGAALDVRPLSYPASGSRIRLIGEWPLTPSDVQADLAQHFARLAASTEEA